MLLFIFLYGRNQLVSTLVFKLLIPPFSAPLRGYSVIDTKLNGGRGAIN